MDADAPAEGRSWVLPALLLTLLVALVATSAILVLDRHDTASAEPVRPADVGADGWEDDVAGEAVVAARRAARTYFTLDHRRVEDDMDRMRALGTSSFVTEYDAAAPDLAQRIVERRLVLSASLARDGAATEYLVTDEAQVLVAVDVTTARAGESRTTRYRTRVTLDLVDGGWLVSALDEVA